MMYRKDRVVWGAVLFRTTNSEVVEGAIVRRSERLHWTSEAAKEEVLGWIREWAETTPVGDIDWESAEDVVIGRFARDPNHVAVIRSMLLPLGTPPRMKLIDIKLRHFRLKLDEQDLFGPLFLARPANPLRKLVRMLNSARGSSAGDRGSVFRCGRGRELRDKRERIFWWER
jgi:hypothetical protein